MFFVGVLIRFQKWFVVDVLAFQIGFDAYILVLFGSVTVLATFSQNLGNFFHFFWSPCLIFETIGAS
jgi:hypothetical protein